MTVNFDYDCSFCDEAISQGVSIKNNLKGKTLDISRGLAPDADFHACDSCLKAFYKAGEDQDSREAIMRISNN